MKSTHAIAAKAPNTAANPRDVEVLLTSSKNVERSPKSDSFSWFYSYAYQLYISLKRKPRESGQHYVEN